MQLQLRTECDWQFVSGRDHEGDKYAVWILVHGSGRILAKVHDMATTGGYHFRAIFHCAVPKTIIDATETFDFVALEPAQAFVDGILAKFDPFAPPAPKPAVVSVAKRKTVE